MTAMLDEQLEGVLNFDLVRDGVYRSIPISSFIRKFSAVKKNALFIGNHIVALVNATTSHTSHSVGTIDRWGTQKTGVNDTFFEHLRQFVLRYATPMSMIAVYMIGDDDDSPSPYCVVKKVTAKVYQLPGCSLPALNGIPTPVSVYQPICQAYLNAHQIENWLVLTNLVKEAAAIGLISVTAIQVE